MNTICIVGATPAQRTEIEAIMIRHSRINIILVNSINDPAIKGEVKEIESPFASPSLSVIRCYDIVDEPIRTADREDIKFKKEQYKLRSMNHGKFNYKRR